MKIIELRKDFRGGLFKDYWVYLISIPLDDNEDLAIQKIAKFTPEQAEFVDELYNEIKSNWIEIADLKNKMDKQAGKEVLNESFKGRNKNKRRRRQKVYN